MSVAGRYPRLDLDRLAAREGVDLTAALERLLAFYVEVDRRIAARTAGLALPCGAGCDACCHESVFVTPLEFFAVWEWVQTELDDQVRVGIIDRGLTLYAEHRALIDAFDRPPPGGAADHLALAVQLRFRCPLLGPDGRCLVYPVRELYARLFGASFNDDGGIYGCDLVGRHLAGRELTLLRARAVARELDLLPLTGRRQVYPHYLARLFVPPG